MPLSCERNSGQLPDLVRENAGPTGTRQAFDDAQRGVNAASDGNRTPSLGEMFQRLLNKQGQSRTARTVECFGWLT